MSCFFFFYCNGTHRDLHSFPTRRSSDLRLCGISAASRHRAQPMPGYTSPNLWPDTLIVFTCCRRKTINRSEEHTSELQSLRHLVCRLLLEKKKKKNNNKIYTNSQKNQVR